MPDVWGEVYRDHWRGIVEPHVIERDDGREHEFESAADYFVAPRSTAEAQLLASLDGPVLDLGAGPGSYALHLESGGVEVTAGDSSPGAVEVAGARGCRDTRVMDLRGVDLAPESYESVIIMGNTLGVHQTPKSLPGLLSSLRHVVVVGGVLLCQMLDPLDTDEPAHLRYHERNRRRGLPPGQTRIRLKYRDLVDDWIDLWMPTAEELETAQRGTGWELVETKSEGRHRLRLFKARAI